MGAELEMKSRTRAAQTVESRSAALHEPNRHRQSQGFARHTIIACLVLLTSFSAVAKPADLGFEDAFPTKLYEKSWFGASLTATTIVAAGAFSYFTAGSGAPAAATGVSSIATLVGGGGPGAYMSGLATVGGWFGGNALVGAAVLNGLSLGTVGGTTSLAKMAVLERALVAVALSSHAISGVSVVAGPGSAERSTVIDLAIPRGLMKRGEVESLATKQGEINKQLYDKVSNIEKLRDKQRLGPLSGRQKDGLLKLELERKGLEAQRKEVDDRIKIRARASQRQADAAGDRIVLAVLVYNLGDTALFRSLLKQVEPDQVGRASYISYLQAISAIIVGAKREAETHLRNSIAGAPFAVEPVILLVNMLSAKGYRTQLDEIEKLTGAAKFDGDAYRSPFNLFSLRYNVGVLAQRNGDCRNALRHMRAAKKELGSIRTFVSDSPIERLVDVSLASVMLCIAEDIKRGRYLTDPDLEDTLVALGSIAKDKAADAEKGVVEHLCKGMAPTACRDAYRGIWNEAAQHSLTQGIQGSKGNERQTLCAHFAGPCS